MGKQKVLRNGARHWLPGLISGAFCTIFRAGPVSTNPYFTSYEYNHENIFFRDPEIIVCFILTVWTAPGAPETTLKGGARRAPPFGVVSVAPRGRPDPPNSMIAGSRKNKF